MSTATVTGTVLAADSSAVVGASVTWRLFPHNQVAYDPTGHKVADGGFVRSASDGTWALTLERTDTMVPTGVTYELHTRSWTARLDHREYITLPAGGGTVAQLLTSPPLAVPQTLVAGPPGPKGDPGTAGATGAAGAPGGAVFVFTQTTPAAVWNINHNLNGYPAVTVIDSGGTLVEGDVDYLDVNNVRLTFSAAFSGQASLI